MPTHKKTQTTNPAFASSANVL